MSESAMDSASSLSLEARVARLEAELNELRENTPRSDKVTILVFSGEMDKVLASLLIGTTAASLGMSVTMFFTFWGINVLKERRVLNDKGMMEKMIDLMTSEGPGHMPVSQMNMLGAGAMMLKKMMKEKGIVSSEELLTIARESGVRLIACSMTMQVMGIRSEELITDIENAGAATYLVEATHSGCTLFI